MFKPQISVIMAVYNQDKYVSTAIRSILSQTYKNFDFLIIDDGSSDNSWSIIKSFKDSRVKLFKNKNNFGLAKSLNFLAQRTKTQYIARMDSDDISLPKRLEHQINFLNKNREIVLVGSWAKVINGEEKEIGELQYPCSAQVIRRAILSYNPFIHSSLMFRKEVFCNIGGYDEKLEYSQDYDLLLRMVSKYKCVNLPEFLLQFRWLPDFYKQRKQHLLALKVRWNAITHYGYFKWEIIKLVKPLFSYIIPLAIKKYYWQYRFSR